jgi:hypothetical protein
MRKLLISGLVALTGCGVIPGTSLEKIEAGYTGLKIQLYGEAAGVESAEMINGGRVWYNGYTEDVVSFPTFVRQYTFSDTEEIRFSVGGVLVSSDVGASYAFKRESLRLYYAKYRVDPNAFRDGLLRTGIRNCFAASAENLKLVPSQLPYSQQTLLAEVSVCVRKAFPEVNIENISLLAPFRLPKTIQEAIDKQYQAQQDSETAKANKARAEADAATQVAIAKGEMEASLERKKAEAQAVVIAAESAARANKLIQESVTTEVIKLRELEIQLVEANRWNGVRPNIVVQSTNAQIPNAIAQ